MNSYLYVEKDDEYVQQEDELKEINIKLKSALIPEQLHSRVIHGNGQVEIQLLQQDIINRKSPIEVYNMIKTSGCTLYSIRAPINNKNEFLLSDILDDSKYEILEYCFTLAQYYGINENKIIPVIIHSARDLKELICMNCLETLRLKIYSLLNKYPNTKLYIENLIPLIPTNEGFIGASSITSGVPELVSSLQGEYYVDRIKSVLDITHAQITINTLKLCNLSYDLEDYFKWNRDVIGQIHLAQGKNYGFGENEHGDLLDLPRDHKLLIKICSLYKSYNYNVPIVIEVSELDLLDAPNSLKTFDNTIRVFRALGYK